MKKTILGLVTLSAGILLTTPVFAAVDEPDGATTGNIQYITDGLKLNPDPVIDPDTGKPINPITHEPIDEDPQADGNHAYWIPNDLNFGYHPIESKTNQSWTARNVDTTNPTDLEDKAYISELANRYNNSSTTTGILGVEDNRGTAEGWDITVKQESEFKLTTDNTNKILKNTTLTIATGDISTNIVDGSTNGITGPSVDNKLVLAPNNQEQIIFTAPAGLGEGVTSMALNSFTLGIPKGQNQSPGLYQANVVWTIKADPTNTPGDTPEE
jgi:hypothetical protein